MKTFFIRYQFANGSKQDWHKEIAAFIAAIDADPELRGKISYRCMKIRGEANYFHMASAADDQAIKTLQQKEFFKAYTERTRQVAAGEVTVSPREVIAETATRP